MVRVLAIADEEAPTLDVSRLGGLRADLVLAAGDLPWDYLEYVANATDVPLVFVPGNHDPAIESGRLSSCGTWVCDGRVTADPRPHGGTNADRTVVEVAGLRIAGLGGCVRYRPGPHQYTQTEFGRHARRLARGARRGPPVDVLLTHAPPYGLGDEEDAPHQGVLALHDLLDALEPTWHLHGHIHPHGRPRPDREKGRTTIANVIPYRVLEIEPRRSERVQHRITAG